LPLCHLFNHDDLMLGLLCHVMPPPRWQDGQADPLHFYQQCLGCLGPFAPLVLAGHTSRFAAYCIDCMLPRGHWWLRGPSLQHCRYCLSPRLSQTAGRSMQFWWHMMAIKKGSMSL
jgi:hypothetical protein